MRTLALYLPILEDRGSYNSQKGERNRQTACKCGEITDTEDELVSNEAFAGNSELVVQSGTVPGAGWKALSCMSGVF